MEPSNMQVRLIGIAGGSGSGKTTYAKQLLEFFGQERAAILAQDHYYIDQSDKFTGDGGDVNFDHPSAIEFKLLSEHLRWLKQGDSIQVPIYDFSTHTRQHKTNSFEAKNLILVEGTLILSQFEVRSLFDYSIFLDIPEELRFERRLRRDTTQRGRTESGVRKQFLNQVKPMHDEFVQPSKVYANQCMNFNEDSPKVTQQLLNDLHLN